MPLPWRPSGSPGMASPRLAVWAPVAGLEARLPPSFWRFRSDLAPRRTSDPLWPLPTGSNQAKVVPRCWSSDLQESRPLNRSEPDRAGLVRTELVWTDGLLSSQPVSQDTGSSHSLSRAVVLSMVLIALQRFRFFAVMPGLDEPWDPGELIFA